MCDILPVFSSFDYGKWQEIFSSPKCADQIWGPPSLLFSGCRCRFAPGVKWPRHEANNSPAWSAKVRNERSFTSALLYAFMACTGTTPSLLYSVEQHIYQYCHSQLTLCCFVSFPWRWKHYISTYSLYTADSTVTAGIISVSPPSVLWQRCKVVLWRLLHAGNHCKL
jgi:hypothetical protein